MSDEIIIKVWQSIEDVAKENEMFEKYLTARNVYREALEEMSLGNTTRQELRKLFEIEREAFREYCEYRDEAKN